MASKRDHAIARMRIAGYHDDKRGWTRLLVESRVAMSVAREAWARGQNAKLAGMPCACFECCRA